jgi:hypothetical protein
MAVIDTNTLAYFLSEGYIIGISANFASQLGNKLFLTPGIAPLCPIKGFS